MVEAKNLIMHYGVTKALDDVSFSANEKEVVGLLGPNGAGKTTLMRILTTYIYPAKGTAKICGIDITENPISARKLIGYLPENPPLYMDMRVDEYIDFVGRARGLSKANLRKRKEWVIDAVKISGVWKHMLSELSLGYRQRVGLAQALIHDPKVVVLDEPTSGLDPMQIIGIRGLIRELAREKTIIFSTHILQEAQAIADRLVIIERGKIIANAAPAELKRNRTGEQKFIFSIRAKQTDIETELKNVAAIKKINFLGVDQDLTKFLCVTGSYDEAARAINNFTKEKGWFLRELYLKEPSLEEVFLSLFNKADQEL